MRGISAGALAPPAAFGRVFAVLAGGIPMAPEKASGQTTACNELVADMAAQQKMIGTFRTLDYQIREHFLKVANAILSTYGGWNTIGAWGSPAGKLRDSKADFEQQASGIRRDIGYNNAISEEELQRLNSAIDSFLVLIETGSQISREIDAGRVGDANHIYFETARPNYLQVHGELYTLITAAERRVAAMARKSCG
jgi:hypothetical protein